MSAIWRARIRDALRQLRGGAPSRTLNCGYGHGFSVLEVIDTVKRVSGVDFKVENAPRREGRSGAASSPIRNAARATLAGNRATTILRPLSPTRSPGSANS